MQRVVDLQRELEAREAELRAAHEAAQSVSAAVLTVAGGGSAPASGSGGSASPSDSAAVVPQWKIAEFEELRSAVSSMWEQLDVPPEDVTAFLSECDLLAPFSPAVLALYQVRSTMGGHRGDVKGPCAPRGIRVCGCDAMASSGCDKLVPVMPCTH